MKIRFKSSGIIAEYHGYLRSYDKPVDFTDGEEKDIPDAEAKILLRDFPDNFEKAGKTKKTEETKAIETPPQDRSIKRKHTKRK